jgi:hypothetical protein
MTTEPNPTPFFSQSASATSAAGAATGEVSRRALFVTAGLGVCAAGAVATPIAIKYAEEQAAAAAAKALQDGINQGKQAILSDLEQLGDVSIDTAIRVAELTRLGVKYIVQPLASLASAIGGDALQVLANGLDGARNVAGNFGYHNDAADRLSQLLHSWHDNLTKLPKSLADYANTDITSAETYLKSLKAMIDSNKAAQGSPTPTATP